MRLILVLVMLVSIAYGQNDTTKYFKSNDYGWNWQRGKFRSALILPTDTTYNKLGVVAIGNSLYVGNGTKWSTIGGSSTNIYNTDGTLTGNRVLNANNSYLYFDSAYTFKVEYGNSITLKSYSNSQLKSDRLVLLQSGIIRMATDSIMLYSPSGFVEQTVDTVLTMDGNGLVGYKLISEFDSTSLSNRINLKLNISDTTSMLSPYLKSATAATTYQTILTNPITGTASTNQIAYFNGTSTLNGLSTITYPSLTELSYVKGATSAIQTQLNAKVSSQWNTSGSNINYTIGGVSIGTSTAPIGKLYVLGSSANNEVARFANDNGASANQVFIQGANATPTISRNTLFFQQSRGSLSGPQSLANGDYIGSILFTGYQDAFYSKLSIDAIVDNTVTSSTIPTALSFSTSATSSGRAEVMRLSSAGNLLLGNTTGTDKLTVTGNVNLNTAGNKLKVATGSNASIGTSGAMTAGTITISTTAVTSSSKIFLTHASVGGTVGVLSVGTITNATSFVINSSSALDTSTVNWWIIN